MAKTETDMSYRFAQIADAYEAVARANHYMVGVLWRDSFSAEEFDAAEQVLITRQNDAAPDSPEWITLELALDLLDYDRKRRQQLGG